MKKMQYRVIAHNGAFYLEYKEGRFGAWHWVRQFEKKDEALYALTERLERKRREREEAKKVVIAQETV